MHRYINYFLVRFLNKIICSSYLLFIYLHVSKIWKSSLIHEFEFGKTINYTGNRNNNCLYLLYISF